MWVRRESVKALQRPLAIRLLASPSHSRARAWRASGVSPAARVALKKRGHALTAAL